MRGKETGAKNKIEPKAAAKKSEKAAAKADKKATRETQHAGFPDAGIKHNVPRLG